ncbi:MAG TPA: hypothetical protein VG777_01380 [Thermoanaerobaculia bacterium]|nr:hypothetical protein [Thermoanaerobaculia bacterium]
MPRTRSLLKTAALSIAAGALLLNDGRAAEPTREPAADPLAWMVGRWEGTRTETATGHADRLHSEIRSVLAGAGIEEEIEVDEGSPHYHGLYLEVSDPARGNSAVVYVNARRRNFSRLEGTAGPNGGEWSSVTAVAPHRSRFRIERTGKDSWKRTQLVSEDDGKSWTTLFVDEGRRK